MKDCVEMLLYDTSDMEIGRLPHKFAPKLVLWYLIVIPKLVLFF